MPSRVAISGLLAVLLLSAAACNTAESTRVPDVSYPPRAADWPIEVLVHPFAPALLKDAVGRKRMGLGPDDAEVIGEFRAKQVDYTSSRSAPLKRAIASAKVEARSIGGDAIRIRGGRAGLDGTDIEGEILRYKE